MELWSVRQEPDVGVSPPHKGFEKGGSAQAETGQVDLCVTRCEQCVAAVGLTNWMELLPINRELNQAAFA
jgi:hypothetical protein